MTQNKTINPLIFSLLFSISCISAWAQDIPVATEVEVPSDLAAEIPLDKNVIKGKLDNGLTYYIRKNTQPEERVELRLAVNAGSLMEDDDQLGLAHFTEHMAFNGTGNIPDYIYWKRDDSGNFQILNPDFKVAVAPDESWTRAPFLINMHDEVLGYKEWVTRDWENYIDGPQPGVVRYIFPTPVIAIEGSQGTLKNDGYGF